MMFHGRNNGKKQMAQKIVKVRKMAASTVGEGRRGGSTDVSMIFWSIY